MMTKNRFDKQAIRERMALTGEPYSVAAREVSQLPLTTWPQLDELLDGGFKRGGMYLIGYRPGEGSLTLATNLAIKLSRPNNGVVYSSLELTRSELEPVLSQADAGSNGSAKLLAKNIHITDASTQTVQSIRAFVETQPKVKVLIVDYVQLLEASIDGLPIVRLASIAHELKRMAMELNIVVIGLARKGRVLAPEAIPILSSFPSAGLVAAADTVLSVSKSTDDYLSVTVLKHRTGAIGGEALLKMADGFRSKLS
jgi:replicative DNA helicase